jgi:hypothetical protein
LRRRRAASQWLHRPDGGTPASVVGHLLAVQAQDAEASRLAVRARATRVTRADVLAAETSGELVTTWLMRGTMHLVRREDIGWLHALTAPRLETASRRRLGQEGVTEDQADRAVGIIVAALADEGPLTRRQLAERIAPHGIRTEGQALVHLILHAALRGQVVLAADHRGGRAPLLAADVLGAPLDRDKVDRDAALAELVRRWLAARSPAGERDLARWSGLPLGDVRRGLRSIPGELDEEPGGLVALRGGDRTPPPSTPTRVLGAFDELLLGWRDLDFLLPAEHRAEVITNGGGLVRPAVAVDGAVRAAWRARRTGARLAVDVAPFDARRLPGLDAELADLARFEGRALAG